MEYYEKVEEQSSLYWTPSMTSRIIITDGNQDENILGDAIFLTQLTDSNGKINFSWNEYQEGDLYLTCHKTKLQTL